MDIYYFFEHSSKRKADYKDFQLFTNVDDLEILKHCATRWLSLEKVCNRTLNQYAALLSYFMSHPEVEKARRVKRIFDRLKEPVTKLTLLFLQHILSVLNAFSTVFQADETKIGALLREMDRLLRKLLVQFIQMKHVKGVDWQQIAFSDRELQQDEETIAVGMAFQTGSCSRTRRPLLWGWLFRQGAAAGQRDHCLSLIHI